MQGYFSLISVMEGYKTEHLVCDHTACTGQTGDLAQPAWA